MIKIIETPRDAMQGIKTFIPTEKKTGFINALFKVGYEAVDVGSFVSPRAIPQLADTAEVLKNLDLSNTSTKVMVTVGNLRGAQKAAEFDMVDLIAYPYSMSATFLKLNINSNPEKALQTVEDMLNLCERHNKELVVYNAMAFGNAYGDPWSAELVVEDTAILQAKGVKHLILSDTIAVGTPEVIAKTIAAVTDNFGNMEIGAHLHTTPDDWHENLKAAWDNGCRRFDAVINGMGGCPMSKRKMVGNLSTVNLLSFLDEINEPHGLNITEFNKALMKAAFLQG
jgi:hydroxymethylglutaryl-CoA lyase